MKTLQEFRLKDRWMLHSYYTIDPYAPDASGCLLAAAADLDSRKGSVVILNNKVELCDEFGTHELESSFFHTGFWQSWSQDARYVYYQSGSLKNPSIRRRELANGSEIELEGDFEGAPRSGSTIASGLMGLLYAAGYGYGVYNPSISPISFEAREKHGIFVYDFEAQRRSLKLSTEEALSMHPDKEKLLKLDKELASKNGTKSGLTLMLYCVRWNNDASKMLFYFGNHCVDKRRVEPRISCLFTADKDFSNIRFVKDISNGGVHWSWHPDNTHLIGYAKTTGATQQDSDALYCVKYDGSGFRKLCDARDGGHPSISETDHNLLVTDNYAGAIEFWNLRENRCIASELFPNRIPGKENSGSLRNETRVCHHPVFSRDGKSVSFNMLDEKYAYLLKIKTESGK